MSNSHPNSPRYFFRYSLRMLLLFMAVVALVFSWFGIQIREARYQKLAVQAIRESGGFVLYEHEGLGLKPSSDPPGPNWLRRLLGDDFLFSIDFYSLSLKKLDENSLPPDGFAGIESLRGLRSVHLEGPEIDDTCLVHLKALDSFLYLTTRNSIVTDNGLQHLKDLPQLQQLRLIGAPITDTGLMQLTKLAKLKSLDLSNTKITDAGLIHLKQIALLDWIDLSGTKITDEGLKHLGEIAKLRVLFINDTSISDAGLVHLKALPKLKQLRLNGTQITDAGLVHIKMSDRQSALHIKNTKVTDAGVLELQTAFPRWRIVR